MIWDNSFTGAFLDKILFLNLMNVVAFLTDDVNMNRKYGNLTN